MRSGGSGAPGEKLAGVLSLLDKSIRALRDPPPWVAPLPLSIAWLSVILLAAGVLEARGPHVAPLIISLAMIGGYLELRWVMLVRLAHKIIDRSVFSLGIADVAYYALAVALYPLAIGIILVARSMSYRSGPLLLLSILTLGLALAVMQSREAEILVRRLEAKRGELEGLLAGPGEEGPESLGSQRYEG